jgi:REP element-mobilizing transposase RayT
VTVCTQGGHCLFGEIKNSQMFLNPSGKMIHKWWLKFTTKFSVIELDEYIIMPDHMHGIIHINGKYTDDTIDICSKKNGYNIKNLVRKGAHMGAPLHYDAGISLSQMMQWFKTMTTNEYIRNMKEFKWKPISEKLWQRGYYDHIIRNENELWAIRRYITNNPKNRYKYSHLKL